MSLFEWLCESGNMGPVGSVTGSRGAVRRSNGAVVMRFAIAFVAICYLGYLFFIKIGVTDVKTTAVWGAIFIVYCVIAFFVRPEPDTSNMGWLGGLIDNPFRISDDMNRTILFFKIALLPGLFIAESTQQFVGLFLSKR